MLLMIVLALVLLGLCLGSFINALVYRLHWQETHQGADKNKRKLYSIRVGRSICPNCKHELAAKDLVPVLSWLILKRRCRYCKEPISAQYPVVEAGTAFLFVLSYTFWPEEVSGGYVAVFAVWLGILTGLIALAVYDIRWMILPNKIVFPMYALASVSIFIQVLITDDPGLILDSLAGLLVGGGIFYVLFQASGGKWIGGGDVKLGFLLGAIAGDPMAAFFVLFAASLLGSVFSVLMILKNRMHPKSKIAFGPFLIIAAIIQQLAGDRIIDWYYSVTLML